MLIAQITDMHVPASGVTRSDGIDPAADAQTAFDALARLNPRPDFVLLTGDLVNEGEEAEYRRLKGMLDRLPLPLYLLPGNHDRREALRAVLGPVPGGGLFLHYAFEAGPLRVVALDTLESGLIGGVLCAERLAWFEAALAQAPDRPTLVALHHPPFVTGLPGLDDFGFEGMEAFHALIERNPQVRLILSGHTHRSVWTRIGAAAACTCPSTTFALAAELRPGRGPRKTREAGGFMLHQWQGGGFVSHTVLLNAPEDLADG